MKANIPGVDLMGTTSLEKFVVACLRRLKRAIRHFRFQSCSDDKEMYKKDQIADDVKLW